MIYAVILSCEIGFWVVIALGLVTRYVFGKPRLGAFLLVLAPIVDIILLIATAAHLRSGAEPGAAHALAAIYLGFSITYGHAMIRWADVRFAHRYADGPPPVKKYGAQYTRACWVDVVRTGAAAVIAGAVMAGLAWYADVRLEVFVSSLQFLGLILAIEIVVAVSYTVAPRKRSVTA